MDTNNKDINTNTINYDENDNDDPNKYDCMTFCFASLCPMLFQTNLRTYS